MNEQGLRELWQDQPIAKASAAGGEMVKQMKQKMQRFDRTLFWRDVRELGGCMIIIIWFAADLPRTWRTGTSLRHSGDAVLVLSSLFIAGNLLAARRTQRAFLKPDSVREFISGEVRTINRQIRLLQTVLWWYLLPIYCGFAIFFIGVNGDLFSDVVVLGVIGAVFYFIAWVNAFTARTSLVPMKAELEQMLAWMHEASH
jgi:hypothetical protein